MVHTGERTPRGQPIRVIGAPKRVKEAAELCMRRPEPLTFEVVDNGFVPPASPHQIKTFDASSDWLFNGWKAGVYRSDRSHCELSLLDRIHTFVTVPYEQDELAQLDCRYVPGEAVYGGLLSYHFGHFLIESTNRLWWAISEKFQGPIVFQCVAPRGDIPPFASRFFALLGIADRVLSIGRRGCRFDRVIVPERSFVIKKSWHDDFRIPFLTAGAAAEKHWRPMRRDDGDAGLYLSRTLYEFRRSHGERRLEKAFARNGFTVAHPETLPLEEQILLARRHSTIAGIQGSAFHNILFADVPRQAVYISRDYEINQNYFMIDTMMDNRATYIYSGLAKDALEIRSDRELITQQYREDAKLDLEKIFWALAQPGVLEKGWAGAGGPHQVNASPRARA